MIYFWVKNVAIPTTYCAKDMIVIKFTYLYDFVLFERLYLKIV